MLFFKFFPGCTIWPIKKIIFLDSATAASVTRLKKGSLPNTLPFLKVDCQTDTLGQWYSKVSAKVSKKCSLPQSVAVECRKYLAGSGSNVWPWLLPSLNYTAGHFMQKGRYDEVGRCWEWGVGVQGGTPGRGCWFWKSGSSEMGHPS